MRTEDLFSSPSSAVLDAPEESYAPPRRRTRQAEQDPRRDFGSDFAANLPDTSDDEAEPRRRSKSGGYRLRLNGRALQVPKTLWGRVLSAIAFLIFLGVCATILAAVRSFFLHDPRFTVATSSAIESTGNVHVSRAQLLSIFGEDVERNIFNIPIDKRRAELESLPWVQRATIMRLLPDHVRILITERTPIAFVRQGGQIGMVDASGVLLDIPPDAPGNTSYSFPVVTGINANDPLSVRAARMKIYQAFTTELDSTGARISQKLSEVDLSNPEDVRALIPEGSADILVHFGDTDFLARYQRFQDHFHEWLTDHPKLASVDMRYQRQVVLQMQPGASTDSATAAPAAATPAAKVAPAATKPVAKPAAKSPAKPAAPALKKPAVKPAAKPASTAKPAQTAKSSSASSPASAETWHMVVAKPHTKAASAPANTKPKPKPTHPSQAASQ